MTDQHACPAYRVLDGGTCSPLATHRSAQSRVRHKEVGDGSAAE